jgi:hypothetical protein
LLAAGSWQLFERKDLGMLSEKQMIANRNNALKSTGPKSFEGKRIVARNAVRHGLLSSPDLTVIKGEDRTEFEDFSRNLMADLEPVGQLETLLAERITGFFWRLKRTSRMETGLLDIINTSPQEGDNSKSKYKGAFEIIISKAYGEPETDLEYQEYLKSKGRLIPDGCVLPASACQPTQDKTSTADSLESKSDASNSDQTVSSAQFSENLGRMVQQDFKSGKLLEKLLRYEGQIERSLYRAMLELQKLQFKRTRSESIDVLEDSCRVGSAHADESSLAEASSFEFDKNEPLCSPAEEQKPNKPILGEDSSGGTFKPQACGCDVSVIPNEFSLSRVYRGKESIDSEKSALTESCPLSAESSQIENGKCKIENPVDPVNNLCESAQSVVSFPASDSGLPASDVCNEQKPNKPILDSSRVGSVHAEPDDVWHSLTQSGRGDVVKVADASSIGSEAACPIEIPVDSVNPVKTEVKEPKPAKPFSETQLPNYHVGMGEVPRDPSCPPKYKSRFDFSSGRPVPKSTDSYGYRPRSNGATSLSHLTDEELDRLAEQIG